MDKSSLIDFNNEKCYKVISPLIPPPKSTSGRLSEGENNPFDTVLRTIALKDDPFECNTNVSFNKSLYNCNDIENKENIGHLISPIKTPMQSKKRNKLSASPLYISNRTANKESPSNLSVISEKCNNTLENNITDTSLQILSDSFLDLTNSFNIACNLPLPSSADDNLNDSDNNAGMNWEVPDIIVQDQDERKQSTDSECHTTCSDLNKGFLESVSVESLRNRNSTSAETEDNMEISNISNIFQNVSNTSSGKQDDDLVLWEASRLAEVFRVSSFLSESPVNLDDACNITECSPPWEEAEVIIFDDNDIESEVLEKQSESLCNQDDKNSSAGILNLEKSLTETNNNTKINKTEEKLTDATDSENSEVENAKILLQNLTAILNSSGNIVDQRKLGENLLSSLALALNIENPVTPAGAENRPKLQRSKSDSKVCAKSKSLVKQDCKLTVPKLKPQPVIPPKMEKNLKVKSEKEKAINKGPLKALVPLTNMAKVKNSVTVSSKVANTTPPRQSLSISFQNKKTSTPNEQKLKPPMAQSTPDVSKDQGTDVNCRTPISSKRQFGFSISPLSRPGNTNDISKTCFNNSLSPRNTSGSSPNLNKSSTKNTSNSSIPTIKALTRRNSASDMSTSKCRLSSDKNQFARPSSQLKRSSSFQYKSTSSLTTNNDSNKVKKYGMPGTLKSLKLVPNVKKTCTK